jgi:hypothetical protein
MHVHFFCEIPKCPKKTREGVVVKQPLGMAEPPPSMFQGDFATPKHAWGDSATP